MPDCLRVSISFYISLNRAITPINIKGPGRTYLKRKSGATTIRSKRKRKFNFCYQILNRGIGGNRIGRRQCCIRRIITIGGGFKTIQARVRTINHRQQIFHICRYFWIFQLRTIWDINIPFLFYCLVNIFNINNTGTISIYRKQQKKQ